MIQITVGCIALIIIMLISIFCIRNISKINDDLVIEKLAQIHRKRNTQVLGIKLLTPTAKFPTQEHIGDLYDVYADEDITIVDGESKLVSTGIALSIPNGYQVRLYNRSGNPLKYKLVLSNSVGIIDTGYTGEIKGQFFCIKGAYQIKKGDKIMQMELVPLINTVLEKIEELPETDRGAGGFGSTGK